MATTYTLRHTFDPKAFKVDHKKELNAEQLDVVLHGEGQVLVLAGAGSGKTRTIVYRVAYLLEKGIAPENILLVTFTNKAAKEMLFRVERLLGQFPKGLWGGTFHHIANLLLRKYAKEVGYASNFTILDDEDSRDLLAVIIKDLAIDVKKIRFPSPAVVQDLISLSRNTETTLAGLIETRRPEFMRVLGSLEAIGREYAERKKRNNLMDFDDLLLLLVELLRQKPNIRERLGKQFRYILVDEYQDTNRVQAAIVQLLAEVHGNLLIVGDDAQSIYSFRGADISNILEFPKHYPSCKRFTLATNYRSTQPILDLANDVITRNADQYQKKLVHVRGGDLRPSVVPAASPKQEAEFIAQRILELRDEGVALEKIAVLFRAAHQSQTLEFELTKRDIPYEYRGGVRFFERAHIKDVVAYLKAFDNPSDEVAWMRILTLQIGIGSQTAAGVIRALKRQQHLLETLPTVTLDLPKRAEAGWKNLQTTFRRMLAVKERRPDELITAILSGDYRDYLVNQYPNFEERLDDLNELATFARPYKKLGSFLSEVSLQEAFTMEGAGTADRTDEAMVLSTIHQAKGLEWEVVFLIHCIEPGFPNPRALLEERGLEEERRLFYVAVTRAMTQLYLCYPVASDYHLMTMRMHEPSRFLRELEPSLLEPVELVEEDGGGWERHEDEEIRVDER